MDGWILGASRGRLCDSSAFLFLFVLTILNGISGKIGVGLSTPIFPYEHVPSSPIDSNKATIYPAKCDAKSEKNNPVVKRLTIN